jgi:flagellar hook-length control protein FliK
LATAKEKAAGSDDEPVAPTDVAPAELVADVTKADASQVVQTVDASTAPAAAVDPNNANAAAPVQNASSGDRTATHTNSSATHGSERGGANGGEVERARFVQRVAKAFQAAADRGGPVKLRLSPPELGSLRLEISIRNGAMTAKLEAETPAARTALLEGLPALKERLAQQDIQIDRFDVDLMDQSPGNPSQTRDGEFQGERPQGTAPTRRMGTTANEKTTSVVSTPTTRSAEGRLNVVI